METATRQARDWVDTSDRVVEVVEVRGAVGNVVAVVTSGQLERIPASRRTVARASTDRFGSWIGRTPLRRTLAALSGLAIGVWSVVTPEDSGTRFRNYSRVSSVLSASP